MTTTGGNMKSRENKRPAPLKMVKEEVRQYRQPVIIHTYSPKTIHVKAEDFSQMVQRLTGRQGQKRKPDNSPRIPQGEEPLCATPRAGGGNHQAIVAAMDGSHGHLYQPSLGYDVAAQQAAALASGKGLHNAVLTANAAASPHYSPLFNPNFPSSLPHLFSPLPSPNLVLSPNFLQDLPAISPSAYQAFDAFGPHSPFPSQGYGRLTGPTSVLPSPGGAGGFSWSGYAPLTPRFNPMTK